MMTFQVCTLANVLLTVIKISTCAGFIFDDGDPWDGKCFPQDQFCRCFDDDVFEDEFLLEVSCSAQNLTNYPDFRKISEDLIKDYYSLRINLTDNELTTIPTGVFSIFDVINDFNVTRYINLRFERNKISTIENGAFVGVNNLCLSINLRDNRITALPLAFQLLPYLSTLSLQGNPILTFDATVVNSIAKSLKLLELDYKALLSGIKELSVLNLTAMTVYDIPSDDGNQTFNPFLFFRNTMRDILIVGTEITTLPCFLIDGPVTYYEFALQDASNISAIRVFDCQPGTISEVTYLVIMLSGLEEFPDLLRFTPYLSNLNLMHNKISRISEKFIPLHDYLGTLDLSYNRLQTIPAAFRRFKNLQTLIIDYNQITYVAPESVLSVYTLCATGNPWTNESHCDADDRFIIDTFVNERIISCY